MTYFNNAARRDGYESNYYGVSIDENPFGPQTEGYRAWDEGWMQAAAERRAQRMADFDSKAIGSSA